MSQTTLAQIQRESNPLAASGMAVNMNTVGGFESLQRIAKLFSSSEIVPKRFRGNIPSCFIAVDMAIRMSANPLMVMQNLYDVHGTPAWSAQFLIATFNTSGRFSAIRYEFQGKEGEDDWGCRAMATELATGEKLAGPLITIGMAKKEGWYNKDGSKWRTMPEQMLRYRAAAWFVRVYAPEIAMGLRTVEEENDNIITVEAVNADNKDAITLDDLRGPAPQNGSAPRSPEEDTETPERNAGEKPKTKTKTASKGAAYRDIVCPKANSDGSPRIEEEDCKNCKDREGCPVLSPGEK